MDVNSRHSLLREKLDKLGFIQPLPIGSLALVSALLDDLILSNKKLNDAKKIVSKLEKDKNAWALGVEPFKCDNSKLLAECNSLQLEIIRQRDTFQHKIFDLNKQIRSLEQENRHLNDRCASLTAKLDEYENEFFDPKYRKHRNDLLNQKRKPFVSTVRSGEFLPCSLRSIENMENWTEKHSSGQSTAEKNEMFKKLLAEQEANRVKTHLELIELYKSQLDSRNREISRLNQLLVGGRPIEALAKDCCYRGIKSLSEDVEQLQKEKSQIQAEYEEAVENYHAAIDTIAMFKQQNQKLTKELNDLKEIALSVESEANVSLETLHKRNTALKLKLNESKKRIQELEIQLRGDCIESLRDVKAATADLKLLNERLDRATEKETEMKSEIDRLTKKNAKLKGKLSAEACKCNLSPEKNIKNVGTMTIRQSIGCIDCPSDVNRLKIDRDFYKQEYIKLLNKPPVADGDNGSIRQQLMEKEIELKLLRKQIDSMKHGQAQMTCGSIEATIHRLEREKNILQDTVERLTIERNDLRDNLHLTSSKQRDQLIRDECEIDHLKRKIRELETDNLNLHTVQGPTKSTISILKEEMNQLRSQVTELTDENTKLRTSNNQLRLLQEQTENVLIEQQSRLTNSERQLNKAESKLSVVDSCRTDVCREIGELRAETNRLKNLNQALEKEKDQLIVDLDAKTEQMHKLESNTDSMKTRLIELEAEIATTHRQLDNAESDKKHSKSSLYQVTSEIDELRRQIKQLKKTNDNMMFENRRLTNELADAECTSGVIKAKLNESEKEVDKLRRQLQQYVQEVQRAEELLLRKEEERTEMLDHYRTLSHDAVVLEGTNQSLELEAAETKRTVNELESKLLQVQTQLSDREHELTVSNGKVCELTKQVNQLELDIERCKHERNLARKELEAVKELCNKLDIETDKLNAEVNEYSEIRRELERDNERIRTELQLSKAGDKAATESLKQLLAMTRKDLEEERITSNQIKNEVEKLKLRNEELQDKLSEEHGNAVRQETLAKEYNLQIQELRHQLTDSRFERVRSKYDQSNDRFSSI